RRPPRSRSHSRATARPRAALAPAGQVRRVSRRGAAQPRRPAGVAAQSGSRAGVGTDTPLMALLAALAVGYLCGSIPSAYLLGRLRGKNVFEVGSGNMGAMNTARNLGPLLGVAVLLLDVGKGALATYLGLGIGSVGAATEAGAAGTMLLLPAVAAGVAAVAGHCYSVFVGFRGGKGLATALGVALPIYWLAAVYALVFIVALLLITKDSDTAGLATIVAYPFITFFTLERQGWLREDTFLVSTGVLLIALVALPRHLMAVRQRRVSISDEA